MLWLYRFIIGYLEVEYSGDVTEIILNICAKQGISLWGIKRRDKKIRGFITVRDFKTLPRIAKGSGIRVHILKKRGFPFIARRYKKRLGIPVGAAIFFCFLEVMSCFIWTVEVSGNKTLPERDILAACEKIGVKEGAKKSSVNPKTAKQELLLELSKLAWASVNIEGCRVTVNVSESAQKAEENGTPTNLKATADGIITKINITSGNCLVKPGDTVAKGDLLVSGVIERADSTGFVRSVGNITAKTERELTVSAYYKRNVSEKTGRIKRKSVLSFFGIDVPLFLGHENGTFKSRTEIKEASLLGKSLPIRLYTKYYEMTVQKEVILSKDELLKELEEELTKAAQVEKIADFEVKNREFDEIEGGIRLKAIIYAEENIAAEEIMLFSTGN
ncbi:MAG: sporulation protein YqfD [Acutalibacteraceae bacterium]